MFRMLKERVSWQQLNVTPHRFILYVTLVSANHTGETIGRYFYVIYQTRERVFHQDIQTPRSGLKKRGAAEFF